jgi:predicted DNA-binding transcriptional regulator AlpA
MTAVEVVRRERPTLAEIRTWPATVSVPQAGTAWGLSRNQSYNMAKRGEFPATVSRVGNRYKVVTASIIRALSAGTDSSG